MDTRQIIIVVLFLLSGALIFYTILPYFAGIFAGFVFFILTKNVYVHFQKKKQSNLGLAIVLGITFVVFLIPLFILISLAIAQVPQFLQVVETISDAQAIESFDKTVGLINVGEIIQTIVDRMGEYLTGTFFFIAQGTMGLFLNIVALYTVLIFLLLRHEQIEQNMYDFLPFSHKQASLFITAFKKVTYATIVSSGLIAILQGLLLGLSFWIVGIKSYIIWGILGVVLALIPFVGVFILWIPATILLFVNNQIGAAVFLLIAGIFMSSIDNVIRPVLNRKVGDMNMFVTFVGVIFIGLPLFGLIGIIAGPLLLSYFILLGVIIKDELITPQKKSSLNNQNLFK